MKPKRIAIIATDTPAYELVCPNWVGMMDGLDRLDIPYKFFTCRPEPNIDAIVEYAPDLVIYGLIDMVRRQGWRMEIRTRLPKAKIVMWYGDYRDRYTGQINADMSEIDMMFVSNDAQNEWYKKIWKVPKCHYLALGSPIYDREPTPRFAFDFVFIGGMITGGRFMDRARAMAKYKSELGLRVVNGESTLMREKVFKAMPTIYRSAKVVLDESHFTYANRYTSNRHWIITASGGFALTKRFPNCELDYPEGTRAYFDTYEELKEKLAYYLTHPKEREKIRLAGYAHARNHTYDKRFARMFELLYEG